MKIYLNKTLVAFLSLLAISTTVHADVIRPLPNVVFIFADDIGWGDVGPRKNSTSPVHTPNIDQLAEQGMRFTDAHTASAVCAPSRYSAMTGNNPFRGRDRWGTWEYKEPSQILNGQKTVADVLKAADYHTAFFGKWHMGGDFFKKNSNTFYRGSSPQNIDFTRRFRNGPLDHGFDYSFTLPSGIQATPYGFFENDRYTPIDPSQSRMVYLSDGPFTKAGYGDPNWDTRIVGKRLSQKAVDFIDRHHQQYGTQKPFLLYYASQATHNPHTPPNTFDGQPVKGVTGLNAKLDMVVELDLQVARIVNALKTRGLDDNTLIIFSSDNGGNKSAQNIVAAGHDSVSGLRGSKGRVYDGGHRVPFFAKWGDGTPTGSMIQPGSVNNQLIAVHDWVAAMYALTGQAMPDDQALDSANILPLLLGENDEPVRSYLTTDASKGFGDQIKWRSIRAGDWALLLDPTDTPRELYNMATDIEQTTNLINDSSQATRVAMLLDQYLYAINQSDRTVPDPCGAPKPGDFTGPTIDLWKDCYTDNEWHLRATGIPGRGTVFRGAINSEDTFMDVTPFDLTPHNSTYDFIDISNPQRLKYGFKIWNQRVNGVDFKITADSATCFNTFSQPSGTQTRLGAAQIPFSVPFDLSTLAHCSPPVGTECGEPTYDSAVDRGIYIWRDCPGESWHLRVTAGAPNSGVVYTGFAAANRIATSVMPYRLNSKDTLDYTSDPTRIDFIIKVWGPHINGVNFSYPAAADICFGLTQSSGQQVVLGVNKVPVALPINLRTLKPCVP